MNTDPNLSELFDRYLENDLNILERQQFELRVKMDLAFAERFRLHKEVDQALIEDDILDFRMQLERISTENVSLCSSVPMVVAEDMTPEIDVAILEQDVISLRDQLNRIHASVIEEVDPSEILGYSGIEQAILQQDSIALNKELGVFEELLHHDKVVQDSDLFRLTQDVDSAILQDDIMELRMKLEQLGETVIPSRKVVPMRRKVIANATRAIAAIALVVIGSAVFLTLNSGNSGSDRLVDKYFVSYDGIGNKRGPSENGIRVVELGIQKYNKGEYKNALELFEASIADNISNETILLYAGTSALLTGDPDKALRFFSNWDESSPMFEQIQWYSAGCYLKKGDIEKATAILNKISEDQEHNYYSQATAILKKVRKDI